MEQQIKVYTDGSCFPNPGYGSWAYVVVQNDEIIHSDCGYDFNVTNNQMELTAIIKGLEYLYVHNNGKGAVVLSDSQYCVNSITEWFIGWVRRKKTNIKKNIELITIAYKLYIRTGAKILWVKGHNGDIWNEEADSISNAELCRIYYEKNGIDIRENI
jgi:ribonuclease HI